MPKPFGRLLTLAAVALLVPAFGRAQSFNGSIAGRVTDPSHAVVSGAELVLRNVRTAVALARTSTDTGEYAFRNLVPGTYELRVASTGFSPFAQGDIEVTMNADVRVDVSLAVGAQTERVEVVSVLNHESGAREDGIAPGTLAQLPLIVSGGPRSSAHFAILMPGVSTGGQGTAIDARINGGLQAGDEAVLDGVSMQQGFMSQSGMVSLFDFPFSPDMVSEVKVLTSSYEPQYGSSTSGQIMATTRSGGEQFHGSVFEYHRNTRLNARQFGADERPKNIQHNFGANLGGPARIPGLWSSHVKSYFYANFEGFRLTGGVNRPTLSIASVKQRQGDFSDWRDAAGDLIPIYDPATTRVLPDGTVVRDPFPGNIIPASRISPRARQWLQYLPEPTSGGPLHNYLAPNPGPETYLAHRNFFMGRFDTYIGQSDHVALSLWHQRGPRNLETLLPHEIAWEAFVDPQNSWVNRLNWDHTFGPNLLHHFSFGYLNQNEGWGCVNQDAVDKLPQIAGVVSDNGSPLVYFSDGFTSFGCNGGPNRDNTTTRPTYVANNLLTWVKGSHMVKAGLEYRNLGGNIHRTANEQGTLYFGRGATGLLGVNSGSPIASFLLGAVDNANVDLRSVSAAYPRQAAYIAHVGDTWKPSRRLTLSYGLRWDLFTPAREKFDRLSFFDPSGANPGAGGRPGRLAFAGTEYGAASFGKDYPEKLYWKAFAPRLGLTLGIDARTVLRGAYGIYYDRAFYPGWGGGVSQDGFSSNVAFSSTLGGVEPAFYLEQGFPQDFQRPPVLRSDFRNGQAILYRPLDANERPRSHQWNVTLDRGIGRDFLVSVAYVGSKGEHLPSTLDPLNALDPALLTTYGAKLYDEFQPGQTVLHGVTEPYPGWREQMVSCAPSLAQALLPYPQYCDALQGLNEAHGDSIYHSLQLKAEKRMSRGLYALVAYTFSKLITSGSDNIQPGALTWSGLGGAISPYEKERNRALSSGDVPHLLSAALVYDLPLGKRRKWGGWQLSTIVRYSSGIPFFFRSSYCNVPSQFRVGCIPALKEGANPWAQDKSRFDPSKGTLFDKDAFEPVDAFNLYYGRGPRVSNLRGFAYRNQDLTLVKTTSLGRRLRLQLRVEAFNLWNWHIFNHSGAWGDQAFNTDLASPDFGKWNGTVSNPRNVQVAARLEF